jgi:hypothetical protein
MEMKGKVYLIDVTNRMGYDLQDTSPETVKTMLVSISRDGYLPDEIGFDPVTAQL